MMVRTARRRGCDLKNEALFVLFPGLFYPVNKEVFLFALRVQVWHVSTVMWCVCFRGGVSGRAGSCAVGGSHGSGAVGCVCVAMEEQVSNLGE